jgi:hypothetical protein
VFETTHRAQRTRADRRLVSVCLRWWQGVAVGEGEVADCAVVGLLAGLGVDGSEVPELSGDLTPAALASPLAVADCAVAAVGACLAAAAELVHAWVGFPRQGWMPGTWRRPFAVRRGCVIRTGLR